MFVRKPSEGNPAFLAVHFILEIYCPQIDHQNCMRYSGLDVQATVVQLHAQESEAQWKSIAISNHLISLFPLKILGYNTLNIWNAFLGVCIVLRLTITGLLKEVVIKNKNYISPICSSLWTGLAFSGPALTSPTASDSLKTRVNAELTHSVAKIQ